MKLTVLGNYGPYPIANSACSGFLIDSGDSKIVMDFGSGVMSRLQQYIGIEEISAIILTHLHSDHMSDIMVLRYAAEIMMMKGQLKAPIKIYAPDDPREEFERLKYKEVLDIIPIKPDERISIGNVEVSFRQMEHNYTSYAICLKKDGKKFIYSGDTGPNDALVEFAKGADFFMCEAGLIERNEKTLKVLHLTAGEAGEIASKAGAKRLLLTHFHPDAEPERSMKEAAEVYDGIVEPSGENKSYFI